MVLSSRQLRLISQVYSRQYGTQYAITQSEHAHLGFGGVDIDDHKTIREVAYKAQANLQFNRNISLGIYDSTCDHTQTLTLTLTLTLIAP